MEEETRDKKGIAKMKCATAPHKRETEVHGGRGQFLSLPMPPARPCLTRGFPDPQRSCHLRRPRECITVPCLSFDSSSPLTNYYPNVPPGHATRPDFHVSFDVPESS